MDANDINHVTTTEKILKQTGIGSNLSFAVCTDFIILLYMNLANPSAIDLSSEDSLPFVVRILEKSTPRWTGWNDNLEELKKFSALPGGGLGGGGGTPRNSW